MGRRGPSRSLFAALPHDLRNTIRTNGRVQAINGPDLESLQVKQELIAESSGSGSGWGNRLLRTQPASISPEREIAEDEAMNGVEEINGSGGIQAVDSAQDIPVVHAESSVAFKQQRIGNGGRAVKRRRVEPVWEVDEVHIPPVQKRRKGKEVPVYSPYDGHPWDCTGLVKRYTNYKDVPDDIKKYFSQRHLLFEEYDTLPLLLDHTGWFSVTAQPIARHIAERCRCDVIVDAFCGVGGNAIEFAKTCERVIAIDNDLTRLKLARHNALQYGLADRIEFIHGSYIDWATAYAKQFDKEAIDVVFLSPPWGGVDYLTISADPLPFPPTPTSTPSAPHSQSYTKPETQEHKYPLSAILPVPGSDLFEISAALTPNIAYYLPRNVNMDEVARLARPLERPARVKEGKKGYREREWVEVEEEVVGDRVKAVTVYYGGLVSEEGV